MKSPYVSELQPNQMVTATFLVQQKEIRQKKTGEPYLSMVLGDRTGEIDAKMWDNVAEIMDTFERDDFLRVRGLLQVYQNRLQLTVHKLQRQSNDGVDFTDYYPASQRDPEEMFAELRGVIASIKNEYLRGLLEALMADPEIAQRYKIAPAAKTIHHAYLGGLIEHVLSLCNIGRMLASHYEQIDLDLLLTGVMLHDIGKVNELSYDRSFAYTSEGQLLGHIIIALRMVDDKIRMVPGFPARLRMLIEHMIVSHHGELGFGSPKVPLFPEALLLHHIDNLDSKMESMRCFLEKDRNVEGCWTGYSTSLERSILKKSRFLEAEPAVAGPQMPAPEPVAPPEQLTVVAAPSSTPRPHVPQQAHPPQPPHNYKPQSLFAEKLQGALQPKDS
jgi:3'-5' exoribonuclease